MSLLLAFAARIVHEKSNFDSELFALNGRKYTAWRGTEKAWLNYSPFILFIQNQNKVSLNACFLNLGRKMSVSAISKILLASAVILTGASLAAPNVASAQEVQLHELLFNRAKRREIFEQRRLQKQQKQVVIDTTDTAKKKKRRVTNKSNKLLARNITPTKRQRLHRLVSPNW
ncbi:MAG: hypothetical protein U5K75_07820 [Ahrensia sp.]|nr:hypothetical protein [Ahrensia sp.]